MERIKQYLDIEHEPKPTEGGVPPAYWPASGDLRVEKLSARYSTVSRFRGFRHLSRSYFLKDGPRVLHEISFSVKAGERVGIGKCDQF